MTSSENIEPREHRGRAAAGVGGGVETARSYLAEEFPTGSERSVVRWLKTLVGRDDVVAIWLRPIGGRETIWRHEGPLHEVPDLSVLFAVDDEDTGTAPSDEKPESRFAA